MMQFSKPKIDDLVIPKPRIYGNKLKKGGMRWDAVQDVPKCLFGLLKTDGLQKGFKTKEEAKA